MHPEEEELAGGPVYAVSMSFGQKRYTFQRDSFDGPVVYTAHVHLLSGKGPNVTLHAGESKSDPIVASAKYKSLRLKATAVLGDMTGRLLNDEADDAAAIDEASHSLFRKIEIVTKIPDGEQKTFVWKQKGIMGGNFEWRRTDGGKDDDEGQLMAFLNGNALLFKKVGTIVMAKDFGDDLQRLLFLTFVVRRDQLVRTYPNAPGAP